MQDYFFRISQSLEKWCYEIGRMKIGRMKIGRMNIPRITIREKTPRIVNKSENSKKWKISRMKDSQKYKNRKYWF
jgi:hypothetical protein